MTRRQRFGGPRRHGATLSHDRRELEAGGWRTTLEYRENHVRAWDGRLRQLRVVWHAEAEREVPGGEPAVVVASASTAERAWARLRASADLVAVHQKRHPPPAAPVAERGHATAGGGVPGRGSPAVRAG